MQFPGQPVPLVRAGLATDLGEQARVLHRDRGLVGHCGEKGDLVVVGLVAGSAVGIERTDRSSAHDQGNGDEIVPVEAVELVVQRGPPRVGEHLRLPVADHDRLPGA